MHELPAPVNFRKRMMFISIQDRFYMNSFPVAKRVADHITFRRMQSSRQFQNHTEQCYLAKKGACGFCKWNYSNTHLHAKYRILCTNSVQRTSWNCIRGGKKSFFEPSSYLMWPYTTSLQWALFLVFARRTLMAKEVLGKKKFAVCRDCNSWCHGWDIETRSRQEANRCHQPTPRTK